MSIPYTYLIGWSEQKLFYYGAKYGVDADPKTLWISYFTSSKYVDECRKKFGEPDIVQVRKIFQTPFQAQSWETKVLRRMRVLYNEIWLNKNVGGRIYLPEFSEEHRARIAKSNSKPKSGRAKIACQENAKIAAELRTGKKDSETTRQKKSEKAKLYHAKAKELGISRKPHVTIMVGNETFYGYKSVSARFGITVTTVHNRIKSDKYEDWIKL